jgi:hypothetical protein
VTFLQPKVLLPILSFALLVGACGSTASVAGTTSHVPQPAGLNPSVSAKMICLPAAQIEIAQEIGRRPIQPVTPTWVAHLYSCAYVYPFGTLTLSVKELVNAATTTNYYNALKTQLGEKRLLPRLGQGGFAALNGSVVIRKDYKVLDVDVSRLPPEFGSPPAFRADDAEIVAAVIMGCWTGD